jgi:hypothetical protein
MKGIVSILELMITGVILILSFLHFFPQYSIKNNWGSTILQVEVADTLTTIDRLNKTYDYAIANGPNNQFDNFMNNIFSSKYSKQTLIWWKEIRDSTYVGFRNSTMPYFTQSKKETIVDVLVDGDNFYVYSFTLGLGYPY